MRVTILGNGIAGNLAALYLRKRLPESVEVTLVGPRSRGGMPVVGESIIEITARFLEEQLGLGKYLCETQSPKYGLTFYFKRDLDNQKDRTYSVQCDRRLPLDTPPLADWKRPTDRPPSWLLNREVFDRDIQRFVDETEGIERTYGVASDVDLDKSGHVLTVEDEQQQQRQLRTDWLIDATGRRRFLGRRLKLITKPSLQRSCFWFRLSGFDRHLLSKVDALGPPLPAPGEAYHYDRYDSTHHFTGRGNWVWLIPLKAPDDSELISIGLVWRPDLFPHHVRSVEDFLSHVEREHPVVADVVRSGKVEHTNVLNSYRYELSRAYSADRWCIIGDAAVSLDPLFSNGLAFVTVQLEQIGEMIAADHASTLAPEYVERLDRLFWAPVRRSQVTIGHWYDQLHDPLLAAIRLTMIQVSYFYSLLPLVRNRCHYHPDWMELMETWHSEEDVNKPIEVPQGLIDLRAQIDEVAPEHFAYPGEAKINLQALKRCENREELFAQLKAGSAMLNRYFREVGKRLGS